jgi:serine/threonine-protein kinase
VYLDFQSRADFTVPKFIDFLYNVLRFEGRVSVELADYANGLDWLKDTVRALHESGRRLVLMLDEFERITRNPSFDSDFFSFLRSLANGYRVAYVTSSCDELQNMCHNKDISDSPFFNIFSNLPLRPFVPADAARLIEEPSAAAGRPLAEHADRILELSGYFPFYLQIACSCLYDHLGEKDRREVDWDAVTQAFLDEALPHFEFMWSQFGDVEQDNLRNIAAGRKISRKFEHVNEDLQRRGYLLGNSEGMVIFSRCFRDFIVGADRNGKGSGKRFPFAFWKRGG